MNDGGGELKREDTIDKTKIKNPFYWRSCCFKLDPRFTIFTCQFVMSLLVLLLCVAQLHRNNGNCESTSFYGNILTTILGLWMPSPLANKN